jgi:hypothetical protein
LVRGLHFAAAAELRVRCHVVWLRGRRCLARVLGRLELGLQIC